MSFAFAHQNKIKKTGGSKKSTSPKHSSYPHINKLEASDSPNTILYLQRAIGNQAAQRLIGSDKAGFDFANTGILQPKLRVSQPNDVYEQEADKVVEQVMRMTDPSGSVMPQGAAIDEEKIARKCAACKMKEKEEVEKEDKKLQISRKPSTITTDTSGLEANDKTTNEIDNIRASGGSSLDANTGEFMKSRFGGYDFSNVKVHTDERAARSAQSVNALAYTVGNDIVFGEGQYAPNTLEGKRLLAHELTHVIQQQAARPAEIRGSGVSTSRNVRPSAMNTMALQRQVKDPRKLQLVHIESPRRIKVTESLLESRPGGGSARIVLYWVDFEVDAKGVMTASVRTVSPDRAYRSPTLQFGDEFRNALEHFRKNKIQVKAFEADWSYMDPKEISTNLKVFKEGLASGMTREKAAQLTPTGRVLESSGFKLTNVENVPESQEHLVEEGVRRWRVKATFSPPTPPSGSPPSGSPPGGLTPTPEPMQEPPSGPSAKSQEPKPPVVKQPSTGPSTSPAIPTKGEVKMEQVKIEYDFSKGKSETKLRSIDLSDYPPDKQGKVSKFFNDRPVLSRFASIAASAGIQYASDKALQAIESHYSKALQNARKDLLDKYPTPDELLWEKGIPELEEEYDAAIDILESLGLASIPQLLTDPEGLIRNLKGAFEYQHAMNSLQEQIYGLNEELSWIADDIEKRGNVLGRMAMNLENAFIWIHTHLVGSIHIVYYQSFTLWSVRGTLRNLAHRLWDLSGDIKMRKREYSQLYESLDKKLGEISPLLKPFWVLYRKETIKSLQE